MALFLANRGDAFVVEQWTKALNVQVVLNDHQMLKPTSGGWGEIVQKGGMPTKAICYDESLQGSNGGRGDKVTHHMTFMMQHAGAAGEEELEGKEATPELKTHSYVINILRFGVTDISPMNKQRLAVPWVKNLTPQLVRLATRRRFFAALAHMAGYEGLVNSTYADDANLPLDFSKAKYNINNSIRATAATSITYAGASSNAADEDVNTEGATARPSVKGLDLLITDILERDIPLLPFLQLEDGTPAYPLLCDRRTYYWLNQDSNWKAVKSSKLEGGFIKGNPMFNGAKEVYENIVLFPIFRGIPPGFDSTSKAALTNVRRCIVLGCDALNIAYGLDYTPTAPFDLRSKEHDLKEVRWHLFTICGMIRPQYQDPNRSDETFDPGTHVWSVYADAPE